MSINVLGDQPENLRFLLALNLFYVYPVRFPFVYPSRLSSWQQHLFVLGFAFQHWMRR
jgi:hypothetical protein